MIILDGTVYGVYQNQYTPRPQKLQSVERGLTGKLLVSQLGVELPDHFKMTLRCTPDQIATLKASYAKDGFIAFTDELGAVFTEVLFVSMGEERPLTSIGWNDQNLMLVDIELEPNLP